MDLKRGSLVAKDRLTVGIPASGAQ